MCYCYLLYVYSILYLHVRTSVSCSSRCGCIIGVPYDFFPDPISCPFIIYPLSSNPFPPLQALSNSELPSRLKSHARSRVSLPFPLIFFSLFLARPCPASWLACPSPAPGGRATSPCSSSRAGACASPAAHKERDAGTESS